MLDNYVRAIEKSDPFITSLQMAVAGTIGCLLVGLPLAYFLATRAGRNKSILHPPARRPVLDELPHPDLRLADHPRRRTWASPGSSRALTGADDVQILGTPFAVLLGLVYGYLPLMVFPLYVTLERMDRTLGRGLQGPRRRPLGDVPPDHAADRAARAS